MRVTVEEIKAKIKDLPDNVRDLVTIDPDDPSLASVTSRTDPSIVYPVHIGVHKDDPGDKSILIATCVCDARVLCWHVVAFYALSKGLLPEKPSDPQQPPEPVDVVQVTVERDTGELRRLATDVIANVAALVAEAERLVK